MVFLRSTKIFSCLAGFATAALRSSTVRCDTDLLNITPPILPNDPPLEIVTWGTKWDNDWDCFSKRDPPVTLDSTAVRQIVMIRHGQYRNESNKTVGDGERTLTDLGESQAKATGDFLRRALEGRAGSGIFVTTDIEKIYVSDLTRAKQTANCIIENLPESARSKLEQPDPLLRERFPCDPVPEYKPKKAKEKGMIQAESAFHKFFYRPQESHPTLDIVVGHGNMIRYFVCRALQIPPEAWLRLAIPHCSITSVHIRADGTVKLVCFGSFSHLDPQQQTVHNIA